MTQNSEKAMSCPTGHHPLKANPLKAKPYSGTNDGELTHTSCLLPSCIMSMWQDVAASILASGK